MNEDFDFEFDMQAKAKWDAAQVALVRANLAAGPAQEAAKFNAAQARRRAKLAGQ